MKKLGSLCKKNKVGLEFKGVAEYPDEVIVTGYRHGANYHVLNGEKEYFIEKEWFNICYDEAAPPTLVHINGFIVKDKVYILTRFPGLTHLELINPREDGTI